MKSADLRLLLKTRGSRRLFLTGLIASGLWSAILIANALLIAELIIGIIDHKGNIPRLIIVLGVLWIFRAIFNSQFEYWCTAQAIKIKAELRTQTTSEVASYATASPAHLTTLLTKGLNSLDIYLGRFIPQLLFASVVPFAIMAMIFYEDLISGFIALLTLPLIPFFGALIGKFSSGAVMKKWQSLGVLSRYFEDSLRGFATLKIFGRNKTQSDRIEQMGDKYTAETMKVLKISFLSALALELVSTLSVAVVAVSVGLRLVSGSIDFKSSLIVLILAPEVYFPVRNAASLFHASEDGTQALRQLNEIKSHSVLRSPESPLAIDRESVKALSWKEWYFERNSNETVVIGSAKVHRGEMLFIVGESGIGKTTFTSNLLGITLEADVCLESDSGPISLDRAIHTQWQKLLGWIPQYPQLATGTVRDQFLLLAPNADDERIERALSESGLSISDLPSGLDTPIGRSGEHANSASGGQIRRIAMARALFRNPLIIVADEPTADLDSHSAHAVMHSLRQAQTQGSIVICITHDKTLPGAEDQVLTVLQGVS